MRSDHEEGVTTPAMHRVVKLLLLGVALAARAAVAQAPIPEHAAVLRGAELVPPTASRATAIARVRIDADGGRFAIEAVADDGLPVRAAEWRMGELGVDGATIVALAAGTGAWAGGTAVTAELLDALARGRTHVVIATDQWPSGEIRGQVLPLDGASRVPAFGAVATGLGGAVLAATPDALRVDRGGVRFDVPATAQMRVRFARPSPSAPIGASLRATVRGGDGDPADATLSESAFTRTSEGLVLSAPGYSIELRNSGALVASWVGPESVRVSDWPAEGAWSSVPSPSWSWPFPDGVTVVAEGTSAAGDEILIAAPRGDPRAKASSLALETDGMSALLVQNLAHGEALTTSLRTDNQGAAGGAIDFELGVTRADGVTLAALGMHLASPAGAEGTIELWLRRDGAFWSRAAQARVVAAGSDRETLANFDAPIALAAGTHRVALRAVELAHAYATSRPGAVLARSEGVTLVAGAATNGALDAADAMPGRAFSGTLWLRDAARAEASAVAFGSGCGVTQIASRPMLGAALELGLHGLPADCAFAFELIGLELGAGLDLSAFGAPGCALNVVPLFVTPALPVRDGRARTSLVLPADPELCGARFAVQGLAITPGANELGMRLSNGVRLVLGER